MTQVELDPGAGECLLVRLVSPQSGNPPKHCLQNTEQVESDPRAGVCLQPPNTKTFFAKHNDGNN